MFETMASSLSPAPPVKPCLAEDSVELNYKQALDGDEQQPSNTTASKAPNRKLSTCPRAHCSSDEEPLVKNSRVLFSGVLGHMVSAAFWSNVGFKLHTKKIFSDGRRKEHALGRNIGKCGCGCGRAWQSILSPAGYFNFKGLSAMFITKGASIRTKNAEF